MGDWPEKHVLLYAHGGLVAERDAIQRLAEYRSAMLDAHIYPISFVWNSDYWSTITNILQDAMRRRRPEGVLGAAKDFLLDRLDDTLEILARTLTGKDSWDEMKENALGATLTGGGALAALDQLAALHKRMPFKLHVVGHSAGSIFHAPLVRLLTAPAGPIASGYLEGKTGYGIGLDTCTLWAPACTTELFKQAYLPAVRDGSIGRFALFALDDKTEQDDNVARIYNKSLLYMVSRAFEQSAFGPGTPILGMEKWLAADPELTALFTSGQADLVFSPNSHPEGSITASRSTEHGAFDDDGATVKATIARMLASGAAQPVGAAAPDLHFHHGSGALRSRREQIDRQSRCTMPGCLASIAAALRAAMTVYFHAARARARTCSSGVWGWAAWVPPAGACGQVTRSNFSAMASVMKRVRAAYMCLSPPAALLRDIEAVRHDQVQVLLGARHGHIQQAPLFLQFVRAARRHVAGDAAVHHVEHVHRLPLLALGAVDGGQDQVVLVQVRHARLVAGGLRRVQRQLGEEALAAGIARGQPHQLIDIELAHLRVVVDAFQLRQVPGFGEFQVGGPGHIGIAQLRVAAARTAPTPASPAPAARTAARLASARPLRPSHRAGASPWPGRCRG